MSFVSMGTGEKLTQMRHVYYIYNGSHIKRHMLRDQNVPTLITTTADGSKFLYEKKQASQPRKYLLLVTWEFRLKTQKKLK